MKLCKNCPKCGREQIYKSEITYKRAITSNSICRNCSTLKYAKKEGDCSVLLEDTNLSYYWIGFILADGHIHNANRLRLNIGMKDEKHLLKLKSFLKLKTHSYRPGQIVMSVMDSISLRKLCKKFRIEHNKTIKPADISFVKDDLLLSLFIGFVDGDGTIQKQYKREDCYLTIKCHSAWLDNLNYFSETLLGRKQAYINNQGYVTLSIATGTILRHLRDFATANDLPILERKWNKITL